MRPGGRGELLAALLAAVGVALLGAPVGLLWSAVAPRPDVVPTADRGLDFVDPETKDFITADVYLFLLCLVVGLVCGVLAFRLGRRHALGAVVGVVLGSAVAAWISYRVGILGEHRDDLVALAQAGRLTGVTDLPLTLQAKTVLLAWPGGAALAFAVLVYRLPREVPAPPPEPVSWG